MQVVEITLGREALYGIRNRNLIPLGGLIQLRNATLEDHSIRTGGGAAFVGSTAGATLTARYALDFWPTTSIQRTLVSWDDGTISKDDGSGGGWSNVKSGLTTTGHVPFIYEGGAEASGNNRKAFHCDRVNAVQVLSGDGAATTDIASPPADWTGSNQPGGGFIHQGYNWMFGNANSPHSLYRSLQNNHENFTTSVYTLRVFPGEGERLVAGLSYKGIGIVWKYPFGVYAVDTSDPDDTKWRVLRVGQPGAAGPANVVAIEDDLLWVAPDGSWHLLSATTATGSVRAEDLTARKLGSFVRENVNLAQLASAQLRHYPHKQEVLLACHGSGQTAKNRRLHMDLNRRTEIGERWIWWDRDRNEALFMRKVSEIMTPAFVDNVGQLWLLDRTDRNANGSAYTFELFTRDSDFAEIVPGWQGRYKNLRFVQLEYDPRSTATITLEVYADGSLLQSISISLTAGAAALPQILPFTLGTGSLLSSIRRRIRGRARRLALRITSSVVNTDISFTRILVGLEVGE